MKSRNIFTTTNEGTSNMTREEFKKAFAENPSSDEVMTEINRLFDSESKLTADFAEADSERTKLKADLDTANRRYRERFLSGGEENKQEEIKDEPQKVSFDDLFKEGT